MTENRKTADLPLAVWPCAQRTSQWQRYGRYLAESNRHPGKMLPALARRAVETYSDPGGLVVDPMCGIGTTLVEAIDLGRRAIGVELEPRWVKLAAANIEHAHENPRTRALAQVAEGDARHLPRVLTTQARRLVSPEDGTVRRMAYGVADLILTSPPYACEVADINTVSGPEPLRRDDTTNYSRDRRNLGHARGSAYLVAMDDIYRACAAVLKPGGFLVSLPRTCALAGGALRNLSGETIALCEDAGLIYWQRVISLLASVRDGESVMRPVVLADAPRSPSSRQRRPHASRRARGRAGVPQASDSRVQSNHSPDAKGSLTMRAAARVSGGDGWQVCHFDSSIDLFCQGLEITPRVWSDRSQPCKRYTGHGKQLQRRPFRGRPRSPVTGAASTNTGAAPT